MINIKELIEDKSKLNEETLPELKELVTRYPFFQVARLLYLTNLYVLCSKEFGSELHRASVFVPDRTALFNLTEGTKYEIAKEPKTTGSIETENDENRTISLIDSFLSGSKQKDENGNEAERNMPTIADLTNDYASFLMQQADDDTTIAEDASEGDAPKLNGGDLIDNFIKATQGKQRFEMPDLDPEEFVSPEFSAQDEEIYTESMVNIYIKQGRYEQALEILRKICLNNPKKSPNFASQIKLLEIITQGNK